MFRVQVRHCIVQEIFADNISHMCFTHLTLVMSGECVISSILSHHNKNLKWWKLKPWTEVVLALGSGTDHVIALGQIRVTPPCYSSEDRRRRESPSHLAPLFVCFFLPLGLPSVNWASQECCLFYLRCSEGPRTFLFCGLFPSLSFSHRHSGLLFPILTT